MYRLYGHERKNIVAFWLTRSLGGQLHKARSSVFAVLWQPRRDESPSGDAELAKSHINEVLRDFTQNGNKSGRTSVPSNYDPFIRQLPQTGHLCDTLGSQHQIWSNKNVEISKGCISTFNFVGSWIKSIEWKLVFEIKPVKMLRNLILQLTILVTVV